MAGFKGREWLLARLGRMRSAVSRIPFKHLRSMSHTAASRVGDSVKQLPGIGLQAGSNLKARLVRIPAMGEHGAKAAGSWVVRHRKGLLQSTGTLAVIGGVLYSGNYYVAKNTVEVYHVLMDGKEVGVVSSPSVVDKVKLDKYKEVQQNHPDVHMVLNADAVTLHGEKAFKKKTDDAEVRSRLSAMLTAHAVGVELVVDGKKIGILKDADTADQVLDQIKQQYAPTLVQAKNSAKVSILSADSTPPKQPDPGEASVQQADFVQKVELTPVTIEPSDLSDPSTVLKSLQTGDVQPTTYKVQKGDSVGKIAKRFNISKEQIYKNNPWIVDDFIKEGQTLDLTVLQPTLSVRTVELVTETQDIQYDTTYQQDDTMRAGTTKVITPGKNGQKKVTFSVTKVNGQMESEELVKEDILTPAVPAVVKKGTRVIKGEGTGKFAWPVLYPSVSSGFGYRWGKLHKGIDITGGSSILAADNGRVESAGWRSDGYGNCVVIDHLNGYETLYAHLSKINVSPGQVVEKGDKLGVMGATGDAEGVHLHFEVHVNGDLQNPLKYLNR